jgi:hypothetical protein
VVPAIAGLFNGHPIYWWIYCKAPKQVIRQRNLDAGLDRERRAELLLFFGKKNSRLSFGGKKII